MPVQCSKCEAPAFYLRRYTAEALCRTCLTETTQERTRRTINKHKMLRENDRIVVAISGGKDSAVLLHVLYQLEKNYPNTEIVPLTIDEGIKGYRDKALDAAHELTRSLGLELEVRTFSNILNYSMDDIIEMRDVDKPIGACSYCGVFRRRALNLAATELGADVIATGHTLDDEAQTIMMNMMRGDSLRIVRTNRPRNKRIEGLVPRIKPIMEITERDAVAYAHNKGLPYHDVPCPYASEAYRNDLRIFLNEMEHRRPGTLLAILKSGEAITKALDVSTEASEFQHCEICGSITSTRICKVCSLLDELTNKGNV